MASMIVVPEEFARDTAARDGERGEAWVAALPGIVDQLLERWSAVLDGPVMHGGVGVIVPVRDAAGRATVLKVSPVHPGNAHEADAFEVWAGNGAVRIFDRDDALYALLLERASTETLASLDDLAEMARVAGALSVRLAVPAPAHLPRLQEHASDWDERLRKDAAELPHALSGRAVDAALATLRELGGAQPEVMVHGDFHARNILRGDRALPGWLAVDPKGYAGDPAYDGGTFVKTNLLRLATVPDPAASLDRLICVYAEAARLDSARVRRWAQVQAVDTALWEQRYGLLLTRHGQDRTLAELATLGAELLMLLSELNRMSKHKGCGVDQPQTHPTYYE
jgi:streptomycin 6-kinase